MAGGRNLAYLGVFCWLQNTGGPRGDAGAPLCAHAFSAKPPFQNILKKHSFPKRNII